MCWPCTKRPSSTENTDHPSEDGKALHLKSADADLHLTPRRVTWLGLIANAALAVLKVSAGVVCHSQTILADGLHSGSDLVTDVAVLASLRVSRRQPDSDHHYGHRRVSTLAGLFVGSALLLAAGWIVASAILTYGDPHVQLRPAVPLALAVVSIIIKEVLFHLTRRVGRRTSDLALMANAWHHRTDAFTSVAAAAGLAGVAFGGARWAFLDHLTAVVLAAFLLVVAVRIIRQAASELVDRAPAAATLAGIQRAVAATEGVKSFHAFRARETGGKVEMDIHVQVDPELTVREGHDIATAVRQRVMESNPNVVNVIVHIEPVERQANG